MGMVDRSSSRGGAKVIWLAVHTTEGMMRAVDLRDWKAWAGSSHASSDETGALLTPSEGFVPYDRMAWTLRNGNPISDNIEQCGWARWTRAEWLARPLLLDATARWLAERSKARGIPLVHLSLAEIRARKPGVIGHGDYTYATGDGTHTDPGPNYPWDVVIDKARTVQEDDMPYTPDELSDIMWGRTPPRIGGPYPGHRLAIIEGHTAAVREQLTGLTAAVGKLAEALASGRDDLTAADLVEAVDEGIRRGGAAVLAAQEVARAATDKPAA